MPCDRWLDQTPCCAPTGAARCGPQPPSWASRPSQIAVGYDGRVSEGRYRVQTVNNYHERFKTWVNRQLRGGSTKHLPSYLARMLTWEWFKDGIKPEHFVVSGLGKQLINIPATS